MAVLHEYVSSSDHEGYYIYSALNGANMTYQVSPLAQQTLDKLDSCKVGDPLPTEVFHTLRQLDLIYTRESGVEGANDSDDTPTSRQAPNLSASERELFLSKLLTSSDLETADLEEVREYLDGNKGDSDLDIQQSWVHGPPEADVYLGSVARTFQGGEWGFIESSQTDLSDDVFFHTDELNQIDLRPGISVEFSYTRTSDGHQVTNIKPIANVGADDSATDKSKAQNQGDKSSSSRADSSVGTKHLSEGRYIKAKVEEVRGNQGVGREGYLHILEDGRSGADSAHTGSINDPVPVGEWVTAQITAIHEESAEAMMKEPPDHVDPPLYFP